MKGYSNHMRMGWLNLKADMPLHEVLLVDIDRKMAKMQPYHTLLCLICRAAFIKAVLNPLADQKSLNKYFTCYIKKMCKSDKMV